MAIRYKFNVIDALKVQGYNQYRLRQEELLNSQTIRYLSYEKPIRWTTLATVCELLNCQPGDILKYVPDEVDNPNH